MACTLNSIINNKHLVGLFYSCNQGCGSGYRSEFILDPHFECVPDPDLGEMKKKNTIGRHLFAFQE